MGPELFKKSISIATLTHVLHRHDMDPSDIVTVVNECIEYGEVDDRADRAKGS